MTNERSEKRPTHPLHRRIFARAVATDRDTDVQWLALGLADAGIMLVADHGETGLPEIAAKIVPLEASGAGLMFTLSPADRAELKMSDGVYQELNVGLKISESQMKARGSGNQQRSGQQSRSGGQGQRR